MLARLSVTGLTLGAGVLGSAAFGRPVERLGVVGQVRSGKGVEIAVWCGAAMCGAMAAIRGVALCEILAV